MTLPGCGRCWNVRTARCWSRPTHTAGRPSRPTPSASSPSAWGHHGRSRDQPRGHEPAGSRNAGPNCPGPGLGACTRDWPYLAVRHLLPESSVVDPYLHKRPVWAQAAVHFRDYGLKETVTATLHPIHRSDSNGRNVRDVRLTLRGPESPVLADGSLRRGYPDGHIGHYLEVSPGGHGRQITARRSRG